MVYAFIAVIIIKELSAKGDQPDDESIWKDVKEIFNQYLQNESIATKDEGAVEFTLSLYDYGGLK